MKIAIFTPGYPSNEDKYNNSFVHLRAKLYKQAGHDVRVLLLGQSTNWEYEGISVLRGSNMELQKEIENPPLGFGAEILCIHSPQTYLHGEDMFNFIYNVNIPKIIWFHGFESLKLSYYPSRINNLKDLVLYPYRAYNHKKQLIKMKKLIQDYSSCPDVAFVFVSKWMKKAALDSLGLEDIVRSHVIPNPVDEDLFKYEPKDPERRFDLLSIRPLSSRKYANDLTIKIMAKVKKGHLDLFGQGYMTYKFSKLILKLNSKSHIKPQFIDHNNIPGVHKKYGLYVSPSRADAQGVSMCEAMASGLPVISTPVGGIPEFVKEGMGFLSWDTDELARRIDELHEDPALYLRMSEQAAKHIREICGSKSIIKKELNLMEMIST